MQTRRSKRTTKPVDQNADRPTTRSTTARQRAEANKPAAKDAVTASAPGRKRKALGDNTNAEKKRPVKTDDAKGKQKGKQVNADAGEALFGGGYPAYYAPGNSWTLGYAGTTPRSAFEGKFAVAETDGEGLFEAYNAMYGRHRPALQRILWAMVR